MAEERNPEGYENIWLYRQARVISQRVKTYAEMMSLTLGRYDPTMFIVDVDETTDLEDVSYFWNGIEIKSMLNTDVAEEIFQARDEANDAKVAAEATLPVTVATYADAVPLFTGSHAKFIGVLSDTVYNDGDKSLYVYVPGLGVGQFLADFDYTTP